MNDLPQAVANQWAAQWGGAMSMPGSYSATAEGWAMWIRRYHLDHLETMPTEREVEARVSQIMSIVEQIPEGILADVKDDASPRHRCHGGTHGCAAGGAGGRQM